MKNRMLKNLIYTCLFFVFCSNLFAQEAVKPLITNINYLYGDLKPIKDESAYSNYNKSVSAAAGGPIFIDDFSYAYLQSYPDQALWSDSSTYVNTTFAIAPWSVGVATFDGLNKHGYPYTPNLVNQQTALPADTLTSKAIDLSSYTVSPIHDSLALTFYYQARGRGDSPELIDSLLLDFFNPLQNKWKTVWYQRGNSSANTNDTMFKRGFVRLDSAYYRNAGFKFRFRNKATTVGNFDHWHLDYVILDINRNAIKDTSNIDYAFGYIPTPYLKNYAAMPWKQYAKADMLHKNSVFARSNGIQNSQMTYTYTLYDNSNLAVAGYTSGATNVNEITNGFFKYKGWIHDTLISNPLLKDTFPLMTAPVDYKIKHIIYRNGVSTPDNIQANDTVLQHQIFSNYFAFDDGSAEGGYYINGTGGRMAGKYVLKTSDTLRSVRIYFDQVGSITSQIYSFRIKIWVPGTNGPSNSVLYKDSVRTPNYFPNANINSFSEYYLPSPLILNAGTYYIGIQQESASGVVVGFDKNLDHHTSFYYDSGNGWTQSSIYGSIMIRPVFGVHIPVSVKELNKTKSNVFSVYPNPAADNLIIQSQEFDKGTYTLINSIGQKISDGKIESSSQSINTSYLSNGLYFLILKVNDKIVQQNKIIIQH